MVTVLKKAPSFILVTSNDLQGLRVDNRNQIMSYNG